MSMRAFLSVLLVLALGSAPPLAAADVDAGIDLWKTLPESGTKTRLFIPADFFGTSSDAVDVELELTGAVLATKPDTPSLGNADTVLLRPDTAHPVTCGASDTVGLRIAALHLAGTVPLTVRYGGTSPETWNTDVYLSDAAQATNGSITIRQNCDDGGTFSSTFTVRPKLIFTRTSDQLQRILDWEEYPDEAKEIHLTAQGSWARRGPEGFGLTTVEAGAVIDANHDGTWEDHRLSRAPRPISWWERRPIPAPAPSPRRRLGSAGNL